MPNMSYQLDTAAALVTGAAMAVSEEIADQGCGELNRVCPLVPGSIAWDECDCGQLAQTITGISPSNTFPVPADDTQVAKCGPNLIVVSVTLSVVRCVRGLDSTTGRSPTCASLLTDAVCLERDRFAARHGLRCYLKNLYDSYRIAHFSIGTATSVGPEGQCAGVELPYKIGLTYGDCC